MLVTMQGSCIRVSQCSLTYFYGNDRQTVKRLKR